jgi:hypothetical protein
MPRRAPKSATSPVDTALSLLERLGSLTDSELARLASVLAAKMEPGFLTGLLVAGRAAVVQGDVVALPRSSDDVARATLKALEQLRPLASSKSKGALTKGLKTAALAQLEAIRTAVAKW